MLALQHLYIYFYIFVHLQYLSFLDRFEVHRNGFMGSLPTNFTSPNFSVLSVFDNQLDGSLPSSLFNLTALTVLYLHQNSFGGALSEDFGKLVNLEKLFLQGNSFIGTVPVSLVSLANLNLEELKISKGLDGGLPTDICTSDGEFRVGVECGHTLEPCNCCYDVCTNSTFP